MKKILSVLLAAVMIAFSLPVTAFAEEYSAPFTEDVTRCEFVLTPENDKHDILPGETVNYTFSIRPNGKVYGLEAHLVLPDGFTLVPGSGKLLNGVRERLNWDDLAVTETNGTLIFTGFTALNPYVTNAELELATFSCVAGDNAQSGTVSLEKYFVLDSQMEIPPVLTEDFSRVNVVHAAENDATSCTFKLTADKTNAEPGNTVNFELSLIPDGRIYAFQAYLSLPENFSLVKGSGKLLGGVKDSLAWDDLAVTEIKDGGLLFSGYTADKPYDRTSELKLAAFSCKIGENASTGTVALTDFLALDHLMNKIPNAPGIFPEIMIGNAKQTVTIPENVTVTREGVKLTNGTEIAPGDVLTITANPPDGYKLSSLLVNGKALIDGTFTVGAENVVITANFFKPVQLTVTFPENVSVTRGGTALANGAGVSAGDILTITANAPDGYRLNSLTVNGNSISNGSTYTVGSEKVTIAVDFGKISGSGSGSGGSGSSGSSGGSSGSSNRPSYRFITVPENVSVTKNGAAIRDGDIVYNYDELRIEATAPAGKKLASLTVNGTEIKSGDVYTVGTENVIIAVAFEDIAASAYTITIPSGVVVTRNNIALNNGDKINEGDILILTANIPSGYKLTLLAAGGKIIPNGSEYTVGKEAPIITVIFEKLPDEKPNEPFVSAAPDKRGWSDISELLSVPSDNAVRIDMNGSTILPASVLQKIKNNGNRILLKMDEKISWSIDGREVQKIDRDIDLKVTLGTDNIPGESVKKLVGNRDYLTLTLAHNGDLGLKALLVINVGEQHNGEKATLHWFNDNAFKAEGSRDVSYGMATFEFTHASDWIIVFAKAGNDPSTDPSTPGTSDPALPPEQQTPDSDKNKPSASDSDNKPKDNDKEVIPNTGSRVSLTTFLALIASAAICLVTRKPKQ